MRNFLMSAMALAAFVVVPNVASADEVSDRTEAIRLCRTEITAQSGAEAQSVQLDQVRVRPRTVRVDFDVWRNGDLQNVRCDVARGGEPLTIASITPALQQTATASAR